MAELANSATQMASSAHTVLYQVELTGYQQTDKVKVIKVIREVTDVDLAEAKRLSEDIPSIIVKGLMEDECKKIQNLFNEVRASTSITVDNVSKTHNTIFDRRPLRTVETNMQDNDRIVCPKCGSSAISTGARGVNMTMGFFGASQTVNRCAKCGYKWKPKR